MSLKTWKKEFYPKEANVKMSRKSAIKHSLKKWIGLREENLNKHEVIVGSDYIEDAIDALRIGGETCALCVKYHDEQDEVGNNCHGCPIVLELGHTCDGHRVDEYISGEQLPWVIWTSSLYPEPMIGVLEKCLENENGQKTRK